MTDFKFGEWYISSSHTAIEVMWIAFLVYKIAIHKSMRMHMLIVVEAS